MVRQVADNAVTGWKVPAALAVADLRDGEPVEKGGPAGRPDMSSRRPFSGVVEAVGHSAGVGRIRPSIR